MERRFLTTLTPEEQEATRTKNPSLEDTQKLRAAQEKERKRKEKEAAAGGVTGASSGGGGSSSYHGGNGSEKKRGNGEIEGESLSDFSRMHGRDGAHERGSLREEQAGEEMGEKLNESPDEVERREAKVGVPVGKVSRPSLR